MTQYSISFNQKKYFFNLNNFEWKTLMAIIEDNLTEHPFEISICEDILVFHIENLNIDIILELNRMINDCKQANVELMSIANTHLKELSNILTKRLPIPDILAYHYDEKSDKKTPFEGFYHMKWQLHKQTI